MIKAQIVADSKNGFGNRLTTFVVTFPRIILAELNTHRMFSRNSASSRAIPFEKMVESVQKSPFIPLAWQVDHKGMQGTNYLTPVYADRATDEWLDAKNCAIRSATQLNKGCSVTKQLCNRLLEPFMYHTAIISATEFENFFALRCPFYRVVGRDSDPYDPDFDYRSRKDLENHLGAPDVVEHARRNGTSEDLAWLFLNKGQAEIHIMALAESMWDVYNESTPKLLKAGEWHIPFGDDIMLSYGLVNKYQIPGEGKIETANRLQTKIAVARCARVSYTVLGEEGKALNYENDIKLYDRLLESGHMSPFEHIGQAMDEDTSQYRDGAWSGNFHGFIQYRKMLPNENRTVKS